MTSSAVSFGLFASTVALKAKCGQLTDRWRADLAHKALEFVPRDENARAAVLEFLDNCRDFPESAGADLLDFVCDWMNARCEKSSVHMMSENNSAPQFEWQKRADLQ